MVLASWLSHAAWLHQKLPFIFMMKFNAALGALLCALALRLHLHGRRRTSVTLAALALLVGILSISANMFDIPRGFGELFVRDWAGNHPGAPGAVPVASALTIGIMASALLTLGLVRSTPWRNVAIQIACLLTFALSFEVIAFRLAQGGYLFAPAHSDRMSGVGALVAIALSTAVLADSWRQETLTVMRVPIGLPLLYCLAVATIDLYTPLELNIAICYIPLVFFALAFNRPSTVIDLAALATFLIVLGVIVSPRGEMPLWMVIINRSLAIIAVWLIAFLVNAVLVARNRSRRSQQHLASAQRLAKSGSFELDFRTMMLEGSHAFDLMHARREGPGSWAAFADTSVAPDDRAALARLIERARDGVESDPIDYSFLGADASARNAVLHTRLIKGPGGAVTGLIGVVQDVTEARKAQAHQAEIEMQLRHAQKLEALGELVGGIAHDLNNTLLPVTMLVPALRKSAPGRISEGLELIGSAADRARELVREILRFSRKDPASKEPLRLDELVAQALPIIRAGIPKTTKIVAEMTEVPEILGSKGQIYQTLLNLVTNAARAIGTKHGTITINVRHDPGGNVVLTVADDGIGMDEATRAHIFEPFFTRHANAGGTGLGLSIVNGIVMAHGGSISVASAPGVGTRFELKFPAQRMMEAA
ncbi:hypothetical protein EUV02_13250 [Polymorphobacter arshaanensis]|uniref:histidine kinase n=1 Tax=Glacieibacterium arshaanense TaxID=2511025 RepID=A0A4Y9EKN8_9SPHN|nr:ATP-binding protein [Polymorphobacter arshaanensis]TFU01264.1 hypothetical protein EUV02_13250 [Polymorphobacter arshaanensis]